MLRENTMIREAAAELQAAFKEGAGKDVIQAAFDKFGQAIAATVQADFETANGDVRVLAQRGFRQLTSEETKYYQALIDAGKQKNPKQAYDGLLDDKVMPNTVIEDVFKDLREEHPLLSRIRFQSVEYLTRWILNDHTVQTARWGEINDEITKEIVSAFQTIEITQCKLSAYAMIEKDMLDLGPVFLDGYIRAFLKEAILVAVEEAIVCGTGANMPIGMDRDIHRGVAVTDGAYPQKTPVAITSFAPVEYGSILAELAVSEVYYTNNSTKAVTAAATAANADGSAKEGYTKHGGHVRRFDKVTLICNQVDFLKKVMPATTPLTANGNYAHDVFPFPTEVIRCNRVETGRAILCLPEEYFMGIGTSKEGTIEYSDDFKFLQDQRVYKIKMHGMGKPFDNTVSLLLNIENLDPAYITVMMKQAAAAAAAGTGTEG